MTAPAQVRTDGRTEHQEGASAQRFLLLQLVFDVALPLGSYYGLRVLGLSQWWCLTLGTLLGLPWIVHGIVKRRKVDVMGLFTLSIMAVATLLSLVTGDPRTLLIRDSWLTAVIGLWVLGTVPTRRPFMLGAMRNVFLARGGEEAAAGWDSRWDTDPAFRQKLRFLTGVWGTVFTLDAGVRVACAAVLPVDTVPTVNTVQWLVVLAGLMVFHKRYITRKGLTA
ncbi:VC0807 family protein [Streptomyces nondiastaticus]|uniref:VC0807 family protein n=1 Tax=Streptomyces nondiastaticus TaxID=3154512 RepID=A0ABW6U4P3_9ACTN